MLQLIWTAGEFVLGLSNSRESETLMLYKSMMPPFFNCDYPNYRVPPFSLILSHDLNCQAYTIFAFVTIKFSILMNFNGVVRLKNNYIYIS